MNTLITGSTIAAIAYFALLVIRILGHPMLSTQPSILVRQSAVILYLVGIAILIRFIRASESWFPAFYQRIFPYVIPSALVAMIADYVANDRNRFFAGGFWSVLYDVSLCLVLLAFIYRLVGIIKQKRAGEDRMPSDGGDGSNGGNDSDGGDDSDLKYPFQSRPSLGRTGTDRLGREDFAKHLASILEERMKSRNDNSLTIGLYGPWGSGKTSIFDLMESKYIDKERVIRFQPWYLGKDQNNIIPEFLKKLILNLKPRVTDSNQRLILELTNYQKYLTPISLRPPGAIVNFKDFSMNPEFSKDYEDADNMRKRIIDLLRESPLPLVVFIDDIDRLDNKEIQMVFKLIRLIADFPNITYVVAMDEEIVAKSLAQLYSKDYEMKAGLKYIEKFIHVPIYLPQADPYLLARRFNEWLQQFLDRHFIKVSETYVFDLVRHFRFTPRNLERLQNILLVHIPLLEGEVCPDDLIALMAIKIDNPELFAFIYNQSELFLGEQLTTEEKNEQMQAVNTRYASYRLWLSRLFPALDGQNVNDDEMAKNKRICSPVHFHTYFQYAVPHRKVSNKQLRLFYDTLIQQEGDAVQAYDSMVDFSDHDEVNVKLRLDIEPGNGQINLKLLEFMLSYYPSYQEAAGSARRLIKDLLGLLLLDEDNTEVYSQLGRYNERLSVSADLYRSTVNDTTRSKLERYIVTSMDLHQVIADGNDFMDITLSIWFDAADAEDQRLHITEWATHHPVWPLVRAMSGRPFAPLEEEFNAFVLYARIINVLPVEYILRDLAGYVTVSNEQDAKKLIREKPEDEEKILLSYMHATSYAYAEQTLVKMMDSPKANWKVALHHALELICRYGDAENLSNIIEMWESYKRKVNDPTLSGNERENGSLRG